MLYRQTSGGPTGKPSATQKYFCLLARSLHVKIGCGCAALGPSVVLVFPPAKTLAHPAPAIHSKLCALGSPPPPGFPQLRAVGYRVRSRISSVAGRQRARQDQYARGDLSAGYAPIVSRSRRSADDPARAKRLFRGRELVGPGRPGNQDILVVARTKPEPRWSAGPRLNRVPGCAARRGFLRRGCAIDQGHGPGPAAIPGFIAHPDASDVPGGSSALRPCLAFAQRLAEATQS